MNFQLKYVHYLNQEHCHDWSFLRGILKDEYFNKKQH